MVKNLPAMPETWVLYLGWEEALEKEISIHSNILAWRIPCSEEPGMLKSMGSQSQTQLSNLHFTSTSCFGVCFVNVCVRSSTPAYYNYHENPQKMGDSELRLEQGGTMFPDICFQIYFSVLKNNCLDLFPKYQSVSPKIMWPKQLRILQIGWTVVNLSM